MNCPCADLGENNTPHNNTMSNFHNCFTSAFPVSVNGVLEVFLETLETLETSNSFTPCNGKPSQPHFQTLFSGRRGIRLPFCLHVFIFLFSSCLFIRHQHSKLQGSPLSLLTASLETICHGRSWSLSQGSRTQSRQPCADPVPSACSDDAALPVPWLCAQLRANLHRPTYI